MRKLLTIIIFALTLGIAKGQDVVVLAEPPIEGGWLQDSILPRGLGWEVSATTFFRDAEFFLPETEGYTASGFRLEPSLRYGICEEAQIRGGLIVTALAGTEGLWKVEPALAIDYQPSSSVRLTMGTLEGSLHHRLGEPMYDRERWYYDYKEDGLQILTHTSHWSSDTWLNWEHFLEPWTPDQERFTLGTSQEITILHLNEEGDKEPNRIVVPLAFTGSHRGGQFSTLDTCIETLFNESVGLRLEAGKKHRLVAELPCFFFQNMSPHNERHTAYEQGYAFYPQLKYRGRFGKSRLHEIDGAIGYYKAHQYLSPRGSYLFQCVSWSDPNFAVPDREMATAALSYHQRISEHFFLSLDSQFYYDLDLEKLDFAIGLAMRFDISGQKKLTPVK